MCVWIAASVLVSGLLLLLSVEAEVRSSRPIGRNAATGPVETALLIGSSNSVTAGNHRGRIGYAFPCSRSLARGDAR